MVLLHQHVVVDVADGQRAMLADEGQHLAQVGIGYRREPDAAALPVSLHSTDIEAHILGWQVGEGMRPIFEHALVDALGLAQMLALVARDARVENVMVAALDHVDGIDLHVAQMRYRGTRRRGTVAERRIGVEPLRLEPDASGVGLAENEGVFGWAGHERAAVYN